MKVNKIVCLDEDVITFLKTTNASKLINDLLREHMKDADIMSMSIEELRAERDIIALEKAHKAKLLEIRKNAKTRN